MFSVASEGECNVGPFFINDILIDKKYVDLLHRLLSDFLNEHVLLADLTKMWFPA